MQGSIDGQHKMMATEDGAQPLCGSHASQCCAISCCIAVLLTRQSTPLLQADSIVVRVTWHSLHDLIQATVDPCSRNLKRVATAVWQGDKRECRTGSEPGGATAIDHCSCTEHR